MSRSRRNAKRRRQKWMRCRLTGRQLDRALGEWLWAKSEYARAEGEDMADFAARFRRAFNVPRDTRPAPRISR